jgi:hypothetical protein
MVESGCGEAVSELEDAMMTLQELDQLRYAEIVWNADAPGGAGPDIQATAQYAEYRRQPGGEPRKRWRTLEVISFEEARRRIASAAGAIYDPWTRALLPPDEAELWTDLNLLYAAHWGNDARPAEWDGGRWADAESLLFDAKVGFPKIGKLLNAFKGLPESVKAAAKERATTARQNRTDPTVVSVADVLSRTRLEDFLRDRFSPGEAARMIGNMPGGAEIVRELPNYDLASRSSYAHKAAEQLFEVGFPASHLLEALLEKRPHLRHEILALRTR